ncbi:poly(A) polymerase-like isoform X2 [Ptychodera flava]|uniref:poly(A) polymerase-like isoform X2 n=1 Tax=Ptychodera flava TaxID=63121 RepID=UPI00396A0602
MSSKPQRACKTCLVDLKHHKGPSGHLCRENKDNSFEMDLKSSPNVNLPTPADHLKKTRDTIRTEWLKPDTSEGNLDIITPKRQMIDAIRKENEELEIEVELKRELARNEKLKAARAKECPDKPSIQSIRQDTALDRKVSKFKHRIKMLDADSTATSSSGTDSDSTTQSEQGDGATRKTGTDGTAVVTNPLPVITTATIAESSETTVSSLLTKTNVTTSVSNPATTVAIGHAHCHPPAEVIRHAIGNNPTTVVVPPPQTNFTTITATQTIDNAATAIQSSYPMLTSRRQQTAAEVITGTHHPATVAAMEPTINNPSVGQKVTTVAAMEPTINNPSVGQKVTYNPVFMTTTQLPPTSNSDTIAALQDMNCAVVVPSTHIHPSDTISTSGDRTKGLQPPGTVNRHPQAQQMTSTGTIQHGPTCKTLSNPFRRLPSVQARKRT